MRNLCKTLRIKIFTIFILSHSCIWLAVRQHGIGRPPHHRLYWCISPVSISAQTVVCAANVVVFQLLSHYFEYHTHCKWEEDNLLSIVWPHLFSLFVSLFAHLFFKIILFFLPMYFSTITIITDTHLSIERRLTKPIHIFNVSLLIFISKLFDFTFHAPSYSQIESFGSFRCDFSFLISFLNSFFSNLSFSAVFFCDFGTFVTHALYSFFFDSRLICSFILPFSLAFRLNSIC